MCRFSLIFFILCNLAAAQNRETAILGGPCLPENDIGWHELVRKHGQELRRGNREAALALAKQIVRGHCSYEYWWIRLAESLAELGRVEESIATLEVLYARGSNAVDATLRRTNSPLHRLRASGVYRRSALAAKLAADRQALDKRRSEARATLATIPRPPENYVAKSLPVRVLCLREMVRTSGDAALCRSWKH